MDVGYREHTYLHYCTEMYAYMHYNMWKVAFWASMDSMNVWKKARRLDLLNRYSVLQDHLSVGRISVGP